MPSWQALLLLDADFVPPTSLAAAYQASPRAYQELLAQLRQGQTVVLPAFETASGGAEGRALALAAAQRESQQGMAWPAVGDFGQ